MKSVPPQPAAERREFVTIDGKRLETLRIDARPARTYDRHAARRAGLNRAVEGFSSTRGGTHRVWGTGVFTLWTWQF